MKGIPKILANQLLRSGTSIGANLEESKGGQSRADYLSKVSIFPQKEARETLTGFVCSLPLTSFPNATSHRCSTNPPNRRYPHNHR